MTSRSPADRRAPLPRAVGLLHLALCAAVALPATLAALGCGAPPPVPAVPAVPPDPDAAVHVAPRTYLVRGVVTQLPDARYGNVIFLHHEPIDDFVDFTGTVSGMDAMTMPFPLAAGVAIDGLSVGEVIEAALEVDWSRTEAPARVTGWQRLPPETELHFGPAQPAAPAVGDRGPAAGTGG